MSKSTDLCFNAHKIENADKKLIESAVATNIDRGMDEKAAYLAAAKERLKAFEKQLQRIEKETIAAYMAKDPEDAADILSGKQTKIEGEKKEYPFGRIDKEDQLFGTRVKVLPTALKGDAEWSGTIQSTMNGGRLFSVLKDGGDISFRISGDRIVAEDQVSEPINEDQVDSNQGEAKRYRYGMRARPLSMGAQPKGHVAYFPDETANGNRWGVVEYDRPLTDKEVYDFELRPIATRDESPQVDPQDADLQAALGHLGDVLGDMFGGQMNVVEKRYSAKDLLPALSKVIELLVKKGFKSFKQSVTETMKLMRGNAQIAPYVDSVSPRQLRAAYNSIAEFNEGTDTEASVNALSDNDVMAMVNPQSDTKAEIDAAAHEAAASKENDRPAPTKAQAEAGNYKHGHINVHGLDIAIENPENSERTNLDVDAIMDAGAGLLGAARTSLYAAKETASKGNYGEATTQFMAAAKMAREDGKTAQADAITKALDGVWISTMPNGVHYGYLKRTLGADGDAVDVFVGPNPEYKQAWIINQRKPMDDAFPNDPQAVFDEHKVMLGFKSGSDAVAAYLLSFEGKFGAKVFQSNSEALSIDELKARIPDLRKAKPVKAGETPAFIDQSAIPGDIETNTDQGVKSDSGTEGKGGAALDGVATPEVGGTGEGGQGRPGIEPGGNPGGAGNQGVDGAWGKTGRSGGNGAAAANPAKTGKRGMGGGRGGRGGKRGGAPEVDAGAEEYVADNHIPLADYTIGSDVALGSGNQMEKYRDNIAAIKLIKQLEAELRRATPAEQRTLARYVGWGGIPNAFKNKITGEIKADWAKEVAELEALMTPKELDAARASTPNAHFTAQPVVEFMWRAAGRLGFNGGLVLEPSVGTGNFIGLMPDNLRSDTHVTGIELDSLTARIAGALYQRSNIIQSGFEKLPLPDDTFDLAIGNPPFGAGGLRFKYSPELNGTSIHNQFFRASMDAVKPGGLQIMIVTHGLMDKQGKSDRMALAKEAKLLGAIRLPGTAFKGNALTGVVTDILFLQKRTAIESGQITQAIYDQNKRPPAKEEYADRAARLRREAMLEEAMLWVETGTIPDPLGGDPLVINKYFIDNPHMVTGVMDSSGSMYRKNELGVNLRPGETLEQAMDATMQFLPGTVRQMRSDEVKANTLDLHKRLGESMSLYATGAEEGSIKFEPDGSLIQVIERVGLNGELALTKVKVTPFTPWSGSLSMNLEGKWFRTITKLDKDGNPVKLVKDGAVTKRNVYEREIFEKESDIGNRMRLGVNGFAVVKKLVSIRDLMVEQLNLETNSASVDAMEGNRAKLKSAYDAFVKDHGFISEPKNADIVASMPDEGLLLSLEQKFKREVTAAKAKATGMKAAPAYAEPSAILFRPVGIPPKRNESADTINDAVAMVLSESGRLDMNRLQELRGKSKEEVEAELTEGDNPLAYADPEQGYSLVEKNEYLSGNVRRKLEAARDHGLEVNIAALTAVQPEPWSSDKVTPKVGSTWIPAGVFADFANHLLETDNARVTFAKLTNSFQVYATSSGAAATTRWGTQRMTANNLLELTLNSRKVAVYDPADRDGGPYFNQEETDRALEKQREMLEEFDSWIFKDMDRRQTLTQIFNDEFNVRVNRQHDGSHMQFPGKVPDEIISLRRGQVNAIWRGVVEDFVLYDHAVGAGKTFTGIARAMERRRMGISKKPMIVVPNHLVKEWQIQTYRLYPGAKVLAATKKDLEPKNRRRLFAKIAAGDWDLVIVPHSSFGMISLSQETEERFLESQLRLANAALKQAEEEQQEGTRFKSIGVKAAEALITKILNRMDAARSKKRDRLVTFEQMGVDDLTVDESHEFKNLQYSSNLSDVRGMGNPSGSDKALDMYMKVRLLHENKGSVAFMTGTPISNSAAEIYSIMRYLAPDLLNEMELEHFDAFRTMFVDATMAFEPTDSGGGIKEVTRLGRPWSNMRALMDAYYSIADVVTNDDIKAWYAEDNPGKEFPLPKVKGGERKAVAVDPTPEQLRVLLETVSAFDSLPGISDPKERNIARLRLMDRARKVSLHVKAVDPTINDEAGGKLDVTVNEVTRIYKQWDAEKGTQLVFLDRGVPKSKGDSAILKAYDAAIAERNAAEASNDEAAYGRANDKLDAYDRNEINELRIAQTSNWNAYQHIKDGLIASGIPANEIAFIQNYNSDADKEALFGAVRDGSVRVLIGSTPRMGAGTNVQDRLVALHHVDATWKPSDIEQREGRIIRQGNLFLTEMINGEPNPLYRPDFEVEINAYVTKRTVDAKLWALNSMKLKMINAVRYYDGSFEMDFDDEDAGSMAEISALASGDPLMLERVKLISDVDKLYRQQRSHNRRVEAAESNINSASRSLKENPAKIKRLEEIGAAYEALVERENSLVEQRRVTIMGVEYDDVGKAKWELAQEIQRQKGDDEKAPLKIEINGKVFTSKSASEDEVSKSLGDNDVFRAVVDGRETFQRTEFAREMIKVMGDTYQPDVSHEVGEIAGIPVSVDTVNDKYGRHYVELSGKLKINDNGGTVTIGGTYDITPDKYKGGEIKLSVMSLRPAISDFMKDLERTGKVDFQIGNLEAAMKSAERDLPIFEEAMQEKFKHADEYTEKSERLKVVEAELEARGKAKQGGQNAYQPGWYFVTNDSGKRGEEPRELSADDISQIIAHGWKLEKATDPNIASPNLSGQRVDFNPISFDAAAGVVSAIRPTAQKVWNVDIRLAPTQSALPQKVQDAIAEDYGDDADVKGVVHQGIVYLVADQHDSTSDLEATILHEVIGHVGVRRLYGPEINQELNRLFIAIGGEQGMNRIAKQRGLQADLSGYAIALSDSSHSDEVRVRLMMEELLAHTVQDPRFTDRVKALIGKIRAWMRDNGLMSLAEMGETDLLHVLGQAKKALNIGKYVDGPVVLNRANTSPENTKTINIDGIERPTTNSNGKPIAQSDEALRNFWNWFGDSKVVDDQGRPLVVYHGTNNDFTVFNTVTDGIVSRGSDDETVQRNAAFFTPDILASKEFGKKVHEVYLRAENPMDLTKNNVREYEESLMEWDATGWWGGRSLTSRWELFDGEDGVVFVGAAQSAGYDGAIILDPIFHGKQTKAYAVFDPTQIKSATGNQGTFDGTIPDIRYSKSSANFLSDPDKATAEKLQKIVEGKSLFEVAKHIATHAKSKDHRVIAQKTLDKLNDLAKHGVTFKFNVGHIGGMVPASLTVSRGITARSWAGETGAVDVWVNGADVTGKVGMSEETILHELVHATTMAAVRIGNFKRHANTELGKSVQDLYSVTNSVIDHLNKRMADAKAGKVTLTDFETAIQRRTTNALLSPDEVIAWGLTNPDSQAYLESIPYRGKTAWTAFVETIRKMLGLQAGSDTALSEVLRVADSLFSVDAGLLKELSSSVGEALQQQTSGSGSVLQNATTPTQQSNLDALKAKAKVIASGSVSKSVIGDSGRNYTPEQREMFSAVGRVKDDLNTIGHLRKWAKQKWEQGIFDMFAPIRKMDEKAYVLARLSKGAAGAFEAFMSYGKLSIKDGAYDADTTGGVMDKVFYPIGKESTDFLYWIAGNRAEKLAKEERENLFSQDDIIAAKSLNQGNTDFDYTLSDGTVTRSRSKIYADTLSKFNAFNKNVMDMAEQSGLIDPVSRKYWESEFYVPFYRVNEDEEFRGMDIKNGMVRQQAFKKLKGGSDGLNDLLANTLTNWAHLIDASVNNRAAKATLDAAVNVGAARPAGYGEKKTVWYMGDITRKVPEGTAYTEDGVEKIAGPDTEITYVGKKEYVVEDPNLMVALEGLSFSGLRGPMWDALGKPRHWLTIGVTASPFYKIRNLIRDSVQSVAVSNMDYNVYGNLKKGAELTNTMQALGNFGKGAVNLATLGNVKLKEKHDVTPEYVSALAGGGLIRFGTMLEGNEAARTRQLIKKGAKDEHILDSESKMRAFYDGVLEPFISSYNELGNRGEEMNRMTLYDKLRKEGVDHATASFQARDIMDFSMKGSFDSIRLLAHVLPFFNSRLVGMHKLGRATMEDKARMGMVIGAASLVSLALLAAYDDDDDWKKREDWDRDMYWWFKFGDTAYRIPKPFEIGAVATLAERMAELMFNDEMTGKRFKETTSALIFNQLAMNPTPQLIKPIVDIYANKDSFSKRPIETMGMERLDPEYRYNASTSMVARGVSTAIDGALSPVQVDHLVRGYFSWLGAFIVGGADMAVRAMSDEPTRPALDGFKFSTGGLIASTDSASSRYVSAVYDQAKELEQAYGTYRDLLKRGKIEEAAEFREDNAERLAARSRVGDIKQKISDQNKRIRMIEASDLSREDKRTQIVAIRKRQDEIARQLTY